jgi:hypothetical protein
MSARLREDAFLDRCERTRLAYETVRLVAALQEAERDGTLEERVAQLELPRQQSLIEFLERHPNTVSLARGLRTAVAARRAGDLPAALKGHGAEFAAVLGGVREIYRWRDALRARLP